jgi:hypothetical protein
MCEPYAKIETVGRQFNSINSPYDTSNPLSFILSDNIDSAFLHGPNAYTHGPFSPIGQNFMKMYASGYYDKQNTWDRICLFYFEKYNKFDTAPFPTINQATSNPRGYLFTLENNGDQMSLGQMLLRNAAELKFIEYSGINQKLEPFNSTIPNSPLVFSDNPQIKENSDAKILVNGNTIDNCPLMNFILSGSPFMFKSVLDILLLIFIAYKRGSIDIKNTKLANFFMTNETYFNNLVPRFIHFMEN